jgi:hypothetical protein
VFHPVPRVDRWDGIIGGVVAALIGALLAASFVLSH